MTVIVHFVNDEWQLHSKVHVHVLVSEEMPHTGQYIADGLLKVAID